MEVPRHPIKDPSFDRWARSKGLDVVYLFGSQATGSEQPGSDVDIGLLMGVEVGWEEQEILREEALPRLSDVLGVPVNRLDVRVLNDAPLAFQFRVIRVRQRLWESDHSRRVLFEARLLSEYHDFQYYEDLHYAAMRQRMREGTHGRRSSPGRAPSARD